MSGDWDVVAGPGAGASSGYMSDADFAASMNRVYGAGNWKETGGYRSQAREAALRAQGAQTVPAGHTSQHSMGDPSAPGAHDIVVTGMTPAQAAARARAEGLDNVNLLPEGTAGGQGSHLHVGLEPGQQDPWAVTSDPWAVTSTKAAPQPQGTGFWDHAARIAQSFAGGALEEAGQIIKGVGELGDVYAQSKAQEAALTGQTSGPTGGSSPIPTAAAPAFKAAAQAPTVSKITDPWAVVAQKAGEAVEPANRTPVESIAHAAGEFVPALAAAAVNPIAGAGVFGAQGYGETYDEAKRAGADEATAQRAGLENAGWQAGLGLLPIGEAAEGVTAGMTGLKGVAARYGVTAGSDAALGAAMQTGTNLIAKQTYDPNRPWYQQVPESAASMAAGGLVVHGAHDVLGAANDVVQRLRQPESLEPGAAPATAPAATAPTAEGEAAPVETPVAAVGPDEMPPTDAIRAYAGQAPEGEAPEAAPVTAGDAVLFNTPQGVAHGSVAAEIPPTETTPAALAVDTPAGRVVTPRAQAVPLPQQYEAARIAQGAPLEQMPQAIADVNELRAAAPRGYSLFQAIRDLGGIRTKTPDGAPTEVGDIFADLRPQPGVINNRSGMTPDEMRQALQDRGWFGDADTTQESGAGPAAMRHGDAIDDLVSLMAQEASGKDNRVYHPQSAADEVRRTELEHQMTSAGAGLQEPLPEAAAKLAAWRGEMVRQTGADMGVLRQRAEDLGLNTRADATYDELLGDVLEAEAIRGDATSADVDYYEGLIDAALTPEEHEWLTSGQYGAVGEPEPSLAAERAPEGAWAVTGQTESGGEPGEGANGGGADQAQAGGALSERVNLANGPADQLLIPGGERSALQAAAAREGALRPTAPQEGPGGLFAPPEPEQGEIKFARQEAVAVTSTPAFKRWFGDSKVVGEDGKPKLMFHGANRGDRIDREGRFRADRATSGPMAFFTDNPEIASNYAKGKADTSDEFEDDADRWTIAGVPLKRAWARLDPARKADIRINGWRLLDNEDTGRIERRRDNDTAYSQQTWNDYLREARGDGLKALYDLWINAGTIFGQEHRFNEVLKAFGLKADHYEDPRAEHPSVFPVYLNIRKPLSAHEIPDRVADALHRAGEKAPQPEFLSSVDQWDKRSVTPQEWLQMMDEARTNPESAFAFTRIPDWVTDELKRQGYDGIVDRGGKMGGEGHDVWIPFGETQVKSALNRGTFDPSDPSISYSRAPVFYSAVERHIDGVPMKSASPEQWKATLKNAPGIKQEELQWTGVNDWLDMFPKGEKVPKDKLQAFLRDNGVRVDEVVTGSQPGNRELEAKVQARANQIYDDKIGAIMDRIADMNPDMSHDEDALKDAAEREFSWDNAEDEARNELIPETQFDEWTEPGGRDYRELLLTLPKEANPPATHWDTPGVLAHVRFNTRETPDGKKVLFIEEVQSDWHQKGRDQGYRQAVSEAEKKRAVTKFTKAMTARDEARRALAQYMADEPALAPHLEKIVNARRANERDMHTPSAEATALTADVGRWLSDHKRPDGSLDPALSAAHRELQSKRLAVSDAELRFNEARQTMETATSMRGIPDAPFKASWPALVMKRVIRWAVDHGFEKVAWTTGEQQAERYELTNHTGTISVRPGELPEKVRLNFENRDAHQALTQQFPDAERFGLTREELHGLVGRDLGDKIFDAGRATPEDFGWQALTHETMVGGEGMRQFYDRNLVNITNDLLKKHGVKVGKVPVDDLMAFDQKYDLEHRGTGWQLLDGATREPVEGAPLFRSGQDAADWLKDNHLRHMEQHGFDITPKLAEAVSGGQPLFRREGETTGPRQGETLAPAVARGVRMYHYDNPTAAQRALIDRVATEIKRIAPFAETHAASRIEEEGSADRIEGFNAKSGLRHIIAWSMQAAADDALHAPRHEALHALRRAGLFTPEEWSAVSRAAYDGDWIGQYNIARRYSTLSPEAQVEEAVAEKFGEWRNTDKRGLSGLVAAAFRKIDQALGKARDVVRQFLNKNPDWKDVMGRIERGEVGQRFGADMLDQTGDVKFARADDEATRDPLARPAATFLNKTLGRGPRMVGRRLAQTANRALPDPLLALADEVKMGAAPMGRGSVRAQAAAKDFANELRTSAYQWSKVDDWLEKKFTPDQQRRMWEAADEEGVLARRGAAPGPDQGLNRLSPEERQTVLNLQARADDAFDRAKDLGMVTGEGLESYVPRMVVEMTAGGPKILSKASPRQAARGGNLSTTTGQLRQRKHETVEQTEAAAKAAFGQGAMVVRNIRTLALATQRLEQAIAGRTLVEKIKAMSRDAQAQLVVEGANPDPANFFTLDHPALRQWRPKIITNPETGKMEAAVDQNGDTVFEAHPAWVSKEFEGPLKAVLTSPSSGVVRALLDLKAKGMSIIMYSPLMHNAVIWGKAIPADPRGVLTLQAYRRGGAARADRATMEEAMRAGLDPIGKRFFNQDAASILEGPNMVPGRSWTAQALSYVPGLFDKEAGEAVKRAVDKFGDVWHNTFLWDRVADLQMGLYTHIRDQLLSHSNETAIGPREAQRIAAHFANRYAGSLPQESMSKLARQTANLMLFSRSFTMGNMAAYKDMVQGLPSDVRSQIARDAGVDALDRVQSVARRKAISMMVMDVGLSYVGLFLAAAATAWLTHQKFQAPWQNEAGRERRFLIGYQPDGTAVYGRLPTGKVGEELQDWATEPREILMRKLSPYGRLMYAMAANDKGFGQKLYLPNDPLYKNAGRVAWYTMQGIAPVGQIQGMSDAFTGATDRKTATLQALAPIVGVTISKGAPGGPAMNDFYQAREAHDFKVQEAMPDIRRKIVSGDLTGARADMQALGIAPGLQAYYIRVARAPGSRLSGRNLADFNRYATPEQKAQLQRDRAAAAERRDEQNVP